MPTAHPFSADRPAAGAREARRLQIVAARLVGTIFAGEYRSAFRGRGLEFDEVREYQPGDDIRAIDWNVTARQGRPFIKRFIEERELTIVLVLDRSPSMRFGTVRATKLETALEACALLAFAALRSHDKTGLLTLTNGGFHYLRPGKGRRHTLRLIREAAEPTAAVQQAGEPTSALEYLNQVVKGGAVICLLSDFVDPLPFRPLAALAAANDVVAVAVNDPAELELPPAGLLRLTDPETGVGLCLDADHPATRRRYADLSARRRAERKQEIARAGADYLELTTQTPPLHSLVGFFRNRRRGRLA